MPDTSPILSLPYILPAQAQKHVTHNEAIRALDVMVQLSVQDRNLSAPPLTPVQGQRHIVAAGASGLWLGQAGKVAMFADGYWSFYQPLTGWRAHIVAEADVAAFDGRFGKPQPSSPWWSWKDSSMSSSFTSLACVRSWLSWAASFRRPKRS